MFRAKKQPINPNTTDTLVGEGTVFEGNINSAAGIRIEGKLSGDITCAGDVTIGEKGQANSNITARDIIVAGSVHGHVTTQGKLTITSTGTLHGNVSAASMVIDEGGIFRGTSHMTGRTVEESARETESDQGGTPFIPVPELAGSSAVS